MNNIFIYQTRMTETYYSIWSPNLSATTCQLTKDAKFKVGDSQQVNICVLEFKYQFEYHRIISVCEGFISRISCPPINRNKINNNEYHCISTNLF